MGRSKKKKGKRTVSETAGRILSAQESPCAKSDAALSATSRDEFLAGLLVDTFLFFLTIWLAAQIWGTLGTATSWEDEGMHRWLAEEASQFRLHVRFPESFEGGAFVHWLPLTHIIGGVFIWFAGAENILFIMPFMLVAFVGGLYASVRLTRGAWIARLAALFFLSSHGVKKYAATFHQEFFIAGFLLLATVFLIETLRNPRLRHPILGGVCLGCALLTKQHSTIFAMYVFGIWLISMILRDWSLAKRLLIFGAIGFLLWSPFMVKDVIYFHSPLGVQFAKTNINPDLLLQHRKLWVEMNAAQPHFTNGLAYGGPVLLLSGILALIASIRHGAAKRKWTAAPYHLFMIPIMFAAIYACMPLVQARYFMVFVPVLALSGAVSFAVLFRSWRATVILCAVIAVIDFAQIAMLPNYRSWEERARLLQSRGHKGAPEPSIMDLMPPVPRDSHDMIPSMKKPLGVLKSVTPKDGKILTLWSATVFYNTQRSTMWQTFLTPDTETELFHAKEANTFFARLLELGITTIHLDVGRIFRNGYSYPMYPSYMAEAIAALAHDKELKQHLDKYLITKTRQPVVEKKLQRVYAGPRVIVYTVIPPAEKKAEKK